MDECVPSHQLLLSENYIVQSVENIPVSMIDYDKVEMTHLIHSGQLTNGTPVIQIADVNSNVKAKVLHPLEAEIQRDFELKQQQQALTRRQTSSSSSVVQPATLVGQDLSGKVLETSNGLFDGVMQIQTIPTGRESVLNVNSSKPPENTLCHISPINRQMVLEKRQFIIVSDNSMVFNIDSKENKSQIKDVTNDLVKNETPNKSDVRDTSSVLENSSNNKIDKEVSVESDSENEDDDIQPVYDYEPDPDSSTSLNVEQVEKPNKCYMCFKSFRQKKNMYAHIRKIHSTQPKIEGGILCPLCKMHALRQEHLRNHLEVLHEIPIEKEEKLFNTMEEFLSWKEFIERETLSFYVSKSSSKLLANNQQKTYYKCHRSGNYVTLKKENRKKKLKVQGSNKIGATCPAAIEVTENIHGINVTFWKTHVGHDNDLAHLVLSKEDRAKIMDYVASGISWDKILENIKKEETKTSNAPSRLTMVSKQDLRNIKKIHDMKTCPDLFSTRKKIIQGRKPVKERMLRRASQSLVIEKADMLLNLLETTDVRPEFRPKICLMIDNLISTVKRRAVKSPKRESISQKRKQWVRHSQSEVTDERENENRTTPNSHDSEKCHTEEDETFNKSEKSVCRQTNGVKTSKRSSPREGSQKKVISKFCH